MYIITNELNYRNKALLDSVRFGDIDSAYLLIEEGATVTLEPPPFDTPIGTSARLFKEDITREEYNRLLDYSKNENRWFSLTSCLIS